MMWGWKVVQRFPGAVILAWGLFVFWGCLAAGAVREARARKK